MKFFATVLLFAVPLLVACSTSPGASVPSASPAFAPQATCERNGGWWHPDSNFCEYQGTER